MINFPGRRVYQGRVYHSSSRLKKVFYCGSSAPIYRHLSRDFVGTSCKINTPEGRQEVGLGMDRLNWDAVFF